MHHSKNSLRAGLFAVVFLAATAMVLCGCGGGSHVGKKTGKGATVFTITWPALRKSSRLIPAASNVIRIQISSLANNGGTNYGTLDTVRPVTGPLTTMLDFNNLPPGQLFATATAYPDYQNGQRSPDPTLSVVTPAQAVASVPLTIADGQTTQSSLTMGTTITRIQLSTDRLVTPQGSAVSISVTAYNGGVAVLTSPGTFQWTVGDAAIGQLLIDGNGNASVRGIKRGVTTISVTDTESGKSAQGSVLVPGLALSSWPKFHQNESNVGRDANSNTPGTAGSQKWSAPTGGAVRSSPALGVDGTVYVGCDDKYVYALNGNTGAQKWKFLTDGKVSSSPTVGADGTVYVGSENGTLYALDGTQGTVKWQTTGLSPFIFASPALGSDGTIYIGSNDGNIYALMDNGNSYTLKWAYSLSVNLGFTSAIVHSTPAIGADGTIYVTAFVAAAGGNFAELIKLTDNGSSASSSWKFARAATAGYSSPAIGTNGAIYVGLNTFLDAFTDNGSSYTKNWSFQTSGIITSSPAISANGAIYVGSDDGNVYALTDNGSSVTTKWSFAAGGNVTCSPAVGADGTIYVGNKSDGLEDQIYALRDNGMTVAMKWSLFSGSFDIESSPAIGADGTVFIGFDSGNVLAIK